MNTKDEQMDAGTPALKQPVIYALIDEIFNTSNQIAEQSHIVLRRSYELVENLEPEAKEEEGRTTSEPFTLERKLVLLKESLDHSREKLSEAIDSFNNSLG
jgi:hypothetical protein